tara:strand:+ start:720 stop:1064 length:345 start_codon:yes stop_codon:yes gene_type:complete
MANAFKKKTSKGIGTALTQVGSYAVPSSTETTVIGLSVSNVTGSSVDVDVALSATMANTTNDISLGTGIPVPSGSTVVLIGGDQKLVMEPTDLIKVKSSAASSVDVCMSILEIT